MKTILKKILPRPVIQTALIVRDGARLRGTKTLDFAADPLRAANDFPLDRLFSDEALGASWERDHAAISALFGDDDRYGGINPGDRRALYTLIGALKPTRVLEVGTHIGASTLYIARALQQAGNDGQVVTVDILDVNDPEKGSWKKVGMKKPPCDFAAELGCLDRISFIAEPAQNYMGRTSAQFDLIFLDGDHGARAVYEEMAAALKVLRPGGVILLHDYYPQARPLFPDGNIIAGPYQALTRIMQENPQIQAKPLGRLPWPTKQGSHMTSLAVVLRT